jgi:hypothetical protein
MTQKIAISNSHGGFKLSEKAIKRYAELADINLISACFGNINIYYLDEIAEENLWLDFHIHRSDPFLIQVIEELGENSFGEHCSLKIIEIPHDVKWQIYQYDGLEWVSEKHREWR